MSSKYRLPACCPVWFRLESWGRGWGDGVRVGVRVRVRAGVRDRVKGWA